MKWWKTTSFVAATCALLALSAQNAAAQTTTLRVSANGASVTIDWDPIPTALGYTLQAGTASGSYEIASVNLPPSVTRIVVNAPSGIYFLRVRGFNQLGVGPFSNEASVTVGGNTPFPGPAPCSAPPAPAVTATGVGQSVQVRWSDVGAAGYRVEFSRTPDGTELVQTVGGNQTSYLQFVGMLGTFYVRVVAGTACGISTSQTIPFTITGGVTGSGPRTPNPAPGTLIPRSSLGYALGVIQEVARRHPGDLLNSCVEHGGNNVFMFRVVQALRAIDSRWGMNDKRGHRGDMSQDILAYNPTDRPDDGEAQIYIWDIIAGHCTGNPGVWMNDVTDITWAGRNSGMCGTEFCARWTIDRYLLAGFPADKREQ
jgi:hypothetical protein